MKTKRGKLIVLAAVLCLLLTLCAVALAESSVSYSKNPYADEILVYGSVNALDDAAAAAYTNEYKGLQQTVITAEELLKKVTGSDEFAITFASKLGLGLNAKEIESNLRKMVDEYQEHIAKGENFTEPRFVINGVNIVLNKSIDQVRLTRNADGTYSATLNGDQTGYRGSIMIDADASITIMYDENGEAKIERRVSNGKPTDFVITLDVSGSMRWSGRDNAMLSALKTVLEEILQEEKNTVSIVFWAQNGDVMRVDVNQKGIQQVFSGADGMTAQKLFDAHLVDRYDKAGGFSLSDATIDQIETLYQTGNLTEPDKGLYKALDLLEQVETDDTRNVGVMLFTDGIVEPVSRYRSDVEKNTVALEKQIAENYGATLVNVSIGDEYDVKNYERYLDPQSNEYYDQDQLLKDKVLYYNIPKLTDQELADKVSEMFEVAFVDITTETKELRTETITDGVLAAYGAQLIEKIPAGFELVEIKGETNNYEVRGTDENGNTMISFNLGDIVSGKDQVLSYCVIATDADHDIGVTAFSDSTDTVLYARPVNRLAYLEEEQMIAIRLNEENTNQDVLQRPDLNGLYQPLEVSNSTSVPTGEFNTDGIALPTNENQIPSENDANDYFTPLIVNNSVKQGGDLWPEILFKDQLPAECDFELLDCNDNPVPFYWSALIDENKEPELIYPFKNPSQRQGLKMIVPEDTPAGKYRIKVTVPSVGIKYIDVEVCLKTVLPATKSFSNVWLSDDFGSKNRGDRPYHLGMDMGGTGQRIKSVAEGEVFYVNETPKSGFGCFVIIKHQFSNGVAYSFYDHIKTDTIDVKEGDQVKAGDEIATVGQTGSTSTDHVHFAIVSGDDLNKSMGCWGYGHKKNVEDAESAGRQHSIIEQQYRDGPDIIYYDPQYIIEYGKLPDQEFGNKKDNKEAEEGEDKTKQDADTSVDINDNSNAANSIIINPNIDFDSNYKSTQAYQELKKVQPTGDKRVDTMAIAVSQLGYKEWNGKNEYTYWFTDEKASSADWCAAFVSWCVRMNYPDTYGNNEVLHYTQGASPTVVNGTEEKYFGLTDSTYTWKQFVDQKIGDNEIEFTPDSGDLIFFGNKQNGVYYHKKESDETTVQPKAWTGASHVGFVESVQRYDDEYLVVTIEGNYNQQVKRVVGVYGTDGIMIGYYDSIEDWEQGKGFTWYNGRAITYLAVPNY